MSSFAIALGIFLGLTQKEVDSVATVLGVLAGLVLLWGYYQYNQAMLKYEGHKPNTATWFMWGIGGVSEFIIYSALVINSSKEILPAMCALAITLTFLHVWWREKSLNLTKWDWTIIALDGGVVAFYFIIKALYPDERPLAANVLLGADMVFSFYPLLKSTWRCPSSEHPAPWRTWTIAYGLLTLVVLIQWVDAWELIYPVVYLVLHGAVWWLCRVRRVRAAVV